MEKDDPSSLEQVTDEHARKKILKTARANDMHVMVDCIAIGIVQILTIQLMGKVGLPRSDI